jgi:AcrR family transcriptional regulator
VALNAPAGHPKSVPRDGLTTRGRLTRAKLVAAARTVFERSPYSEVRVDHIAREAGVAHGTFYTYFDGKEDIFRVLIDQLVEDVFATSHAEHDAGDDPAHRLLSANTRYLRAVQQHSGLFFKLHEAAATDESIYARLQEAYELFYARMGRGLERLQQHGLADRGLPPAATARALGAMVEGFALMWLRSGDTDIDDAAMIVTRLWCGAIGLPRDVIVSSRPSTSRNARDLRALQPGEVVG